MRSRRRVVAGAFALAVAAASLPGCVLAVGNDADHDPGRVERLEGRIRAAERELGIPSPAEVQQ